MNDNDLIDSIYNNSPEVQARIKREQEFTQYKASLLTSLPVSPDQATKQYQLSKQTGIPVGIVRAKENEIAQRTELATFEDEDFINNFPKVVAQLSNPNIAGAIKDDVDSLSKFEKIARSTKEKYQQSALMDETLDLRLKRMSFESGNENNKLSPSEEALISEFERQQPKDYKLGFLGSIIPETAGAVRTIFGVAREAGPKALAGAGLGAGVGAISGAISPTRAIPQMAAAGARLGLKISAPVATGYEMAKLETAGAYDELRNIVDESGKPLGKDIAAGAAVLTGAVNGAIELIPAKIGLDALKKSFSREGTKQLVKSPIAREYLKNIGKGVVAEGGTEGVQEFFNIMFTEAGKAASKGDFKTLGMKDENDIEGLLKFASDSYSRVKESAIAGGAAGAGFSVVGGGFIAGKRVYDQRQQNQKEKQIISELNQVASQSKVLKRDADLFKEATKETLGQVDFYIPAEEVKTYFQDKPDAFQKFLEIPQVKEQYEEALDLGGNLIIPANEVYANAKINPDIAGLQEFAKLSPESLNELEAQDEFLTRAVPEIVAEEQEAIRNRETSEIKLNIRKQISNLIPTKEQEDYIRLLENYYDTRAKRYGNETAKQILESYLGQLELNQKKFQKPSSFKQIEDLDLMIDKARKPIKQPKSSKPLLRTLKEMGGVKLGSNLASELNAIGVNPKTAPALFKKNGGISDIDNIPLSEFQGRFPNVQAIADETGSYVDRNYLLNLLSEEQFGNDITQIKTPEQEQIDNFLQGLDELGIDLNASNEEIKAAIKAAQDQTFNQGPLQKIAEIQAQIKEELNNFLKENGIDTTEKKHVHAKHALTERQKLEIVARQEKIIKRNLDKFFKDRADFLNEKPADKKTFFQSGFGIIAKDQELQLKILDKFLKENGIEVKNNEERKRAYHALKPSQQLEIIRRQQERISKNINNYLKERQFFQDAKDQTKTEEFKKWFGDSKVVDKKGKPLVVYHGTNRPDFEEFIPNGNFGFEPAIYFSSSKKLAKQYLGYKGEGKIFENYLSIKDPYIIEANGASFNDLYNQLLSTISSAKRDGKDGLIIKDLDDSRLQDKKSKHVSDVYVVFDSKQIKSVENKGTFDPESANIYQQDIKGQTQFIGQKPVITLFEKADRSTLLHELGHLFLQIEADVAKLPNMPADFKKDWATLENWLGVKNGVITREAHEKFARGFEAYLREGKAPSLELRSAFRRFKAWLVRVYQDVMNLNVKLNDNIRGYFDKLLATDEAIETQKNNPIFATDTNVLELLTAKEKEDYIKLSDNAKEKTKEQLLKKAFKQSDIKNKKFYKEELENVKKEIQDELQQDKTYRILTYLKTGKINGEEQPKKLKLNREDVKNNYDGEFIKYLPKDIFGKDGVEVALLADEFGFKSGSEMLYVIANAPDYKARVNELAAQEMVRRYGDMLKDGTIEREALEMAENDARARKIVYELNAINRKVKTITESKEVYKQKAKEIIESKNLIEATDTNKFYVNALKAAREAGKYLGKKDYEKAVEWKKKQLLNHYLFRESKALRDEIKASKKRYDSYKKKPAKGKVRIDEDYRTRIVNLLQDFGLANKPIDYVQTNINELENWKKEKQSEGVLGLVEFPEIADFQNKSFNQLTVQEYRTLDNAIENLAHIGENERFIEVEGRRIELATLSEELSESIRSNLKEKPKIIGSKTKIEELKDKFDEANSTITKAKNIALKLDGEKPLGKFYNAFIKPVGNQELVRNEMIKEASDKLNEIFDKYLSKLSKKREYFQEVNAELSRQNLVAVALNWGNDINKKRIKDGFGWTDQQVVSLLSNLTKNEWSYVQEIWDYLDSFWDKSSSLHKKLLGFAPKKQRFTPFKIRTSDGEEMSLKGGYYPIAYTKESSLREGELDAYKQVAINYEKSYLKERTDKKVDKELTLTLTPLYTHISQVVNDLAMKEATWNSDKVLKSRKVENAITRTAGVNQYKELKGWLEDLFGVAQTPAGWLGATINHLRAGMTISTMGLKVSSVIIQASGYTQSIVKIGYMPMLKGLFKFLGNGNLLNINKSMNEALAKSKILKTRETTYHRDIFETLRSMEKKGKLPKNLVAYYFYPMAKMQMLVDIPTWYGAYYKGLKDFNGDDTKAVDYADLMVVQSQGSGLMQDLSSFERGSIGGQKKSELIKMFTAFYTYFNAKWNLAQESYRRTNFKKPSDVAKFASDMMLLYFIEALIGEAILGKIPDFDDEDEDTFTTYSIKLITSNFFAQFPISREAVSGLKGFDVSPAGFSGLASITKGGVMVSKELQEEEVDITKIIEGLNQGGGVIFHYPSGQVDVFIDAVQRAQEGEEVAPINYLLRDNKK